LGAAAADLQRSTTAQVVTSGLSLVDPGPGCAILDRVSDHRPGWARRIVADAVRQATAAAGAGHVKVG